MTNAGGLGFIGGGGHDLSAVKKQLEIAASILPRQPNGLLPVGIGLLNFLANVDDILLVLDEYKPAIIWLFAAKDLSDYAVWTHKIRAVLPSETQVWIQIGSVAGATQLAKSCEPDVLVLQGIDAGGHGFEKGAGIVSLLPEAVDALAAEGFGHIPLVAAGGISDARGAAAAFALGAQGVVMGTRFLAATETELHPHYRKAVFGTSDGGQNTTRDKLFDNVRGPNIWPEEYDGRSIITESFTEHVAGVAIEEIRRKTGEAAKGETGGYEANGKGRVAIWAGTGVGLVKQEQSAKEIIEETRNGVKEVLEATRARLTRLDLFAKGTTVPPRVNL